MTHAQSAYLEQALSQGDAEGMVDLGGGEMPYFIDPRTGERRILNFFPTPQNHAMKAFHTILSNAIPESDFKPFDATTIVPIANQDGFGACVPFATICALLKRFAMKGIAVPDLSQWFFYTLVNGGRDAGASIGQAAQALVQTGTRAQSLVPYGTIRPQGYSQSAMNATAYKATLVTTVEGGNRDAILSLVAARKTLVLDVRAGNWFDTNSDGTVAYGRGATNHAVAVGGGLRQVSGKWQPKVTNSWDTTWGVKGIGWLTDQHLESTTDVWCLDDVEIPSDAPMPPSAP
jgi:hypothetical protein